MGCAQGVDCTPGRLVIFRNSQVRHWVEGPKASKGPARVILGPMTLSPEARAAQMLKAPLPQTSAQYIALSSSVVEALLWTCVTRACLLLISPK